MGTARRMGITMATATRTAMTETVSLSALYRLMAFLSPAFPVGAFTYSHGLEQVIEAGGRDVLVLKHCLEQIDPAAGPLQLVSRQSEGRTRGVAEAAVHAGFHVGRRRAVDVLGEVGHRTAQALVRLHGALGVVARLRFLDREALFALVQRILFGGLSHTLAPLRVNVKPVV